MAMSVAALATVKCVVLEWQWSTVQHSKHLAGLLGRWGPRLNRTGSALKPMYKLCRGLNSGNR